MAAMPLGTAAGTFLFIRCIPPGRRSAWMGPLSVATGLPLAACVAVPHLVPAMVLWALSGLLFCYQVAVVAEFVQHVPDNQRGQAIGIASSGLIAVQGVGILLGGLTADLVGVIHAVSYAGLLGILLGSALTVFWARLTRPG